MRAQSFAAALGVLLLTVPAPVHAQSNTSETYRLLSLFGDVFERVRADYVNEVSDEKLVESAINGMLTSLDPHSAYLNAKSFREMQVQSSGEIGGLGIEVTMENGLVKVVSPIDDTPAHRAGLRSGDLITHLDSEAVLGLTLSEAVERMRGPPDTDIVLTVRRADREPFDVTITRAVIKIQSVRSRAEGDIGYIRVISFSEQTEGGIERAMIKLRAEIGDGMKGLVLDLRNNPGGLLEQSIKVVDFFLDRGEIVSTRARRAEEAQRFNAKSGDNAEGLPIVVLINGGSASASEIVAGALQDHRRAIVMGTRSFGKGSVQTIVPLEAAQGGAIRLTTAQYYTPSGRSIQAKGIEPDIVVQQGRLEILDEAGRRREGDLRGALRNPNERDSRDASDKEAEESGPDEPPEDYQLARALDLLRGLALYSGKVAN